ncbi:MAG: hypothetical protein IPN76_07075 [Saprospiraceae bacterium]|nr:hypothetical protein [Saprospiraceae bacterium]
MFGKLAVKIFLEALSPLMRKSLQFAHRFVESHRGLKHYTAKPNGLLWTDPLSFDTPVFYIAMHGEPGSVVSVLDKIGPDELCSSFEGYGIYPNLIYFGACSVFKGTKGKKFANDFLKASGSNAVIGYTEDIDWMKSLIIDLLFLQKFYNDPEPWKNLQKIFDSVIDEYKPAKSLGYSIFLK